MNSVLQCQRPFILPPLQTPISACNRHSDCSTQRYLCQSVTGFHRLEFLKDFLFMFVFFRVFSAIAYYWWRRVTNENLTINLEIFTALQI